MGKVVLFLARQLLHVVKKAVELEGGDKVQIYKFNKKPEVNRKHDYYE